MDFKRQEIRMLSIELAIDSGKNQKLTPEEIVSSAKLFESYIMGDEEKIKKKG